jgi:transcription initiation factor IIE alpha subunit
MSVPAPPELKEEKRVRESGGPEDLAFYTCSCGYAFDAAVTTSVTCPHCGAGQAW